MHEELEERLEEITDKDEKIRFLIGTRNTAFKSLILGLEDISHLINELNKDLDTSGNRLDLWEELLEAVGEMLLAADDGCDCQTALNYKR